MSKVAELYSKVSGDAALLAKAQEIIGGTDCSELSDKQLGALVDLGKSAGITVTVAEIKAYFAEGEEELSMDALDAVAGGKIDITTQNCKGKNAGAVTEHHNDININFNSGGGDDD